MSRVRLLATTGPRRRARERAPSSPSHRRTPSRLTRRLPPCGPQSPRRRSAAQDAAIDSADPSGRSAPDTGAVRAIDICRREAYAVAADVGMQQGISLGRTSHRLRNPNNAPRPWAAASSRRTSRRSTRMRRPTSSISARKSACCSRFRMGETCSLCHGTKSWMPADVPAMLERAYPNDEATGFTTGDVRGWIWAEVPKR